MDAVTAVVDAHEDIRSLLPDLLPGRCEDDVALVDRDGLLETLELHEVRGLPEPAVLVARLNCALSLHQLNLRLLLNEPLPQLLRLLSLHHRLVCGLLLLEN